MLKHARILAGLALAGAAGAVWADVPAVATESVVLLAAPECKSENPERARVIAEKAWQAGSYQRSGECYLIAGEHARANEAFIKASARTKGDTSRKLASNLSDMKAQARQMKQAFQHR